MPIPTELPDPVLLDADENYRLFACRIPANEHDAEHILVFAVSNNARQRVRVAGHLTLDPTAPLLNEYGEANDPVNWMEVHPDHRREGIGRRMWLAAERLLGRKWLPFPASREAHSLAESLHREDRVRGPAPHPWVDGSGADASPDGVLTDYGLATQIHHNAKGRGLTLSEVRRWTPAQRQEASDYLKAFSALPDMPAVLMPHLR